MKASYEIFESLEVPYYVEYIELFEKYAKKRPKESSQVYLTYKSERPPFKNTKVFVGKKSIKAYEELLQNKSLSDEIHAMYMQAIKKGNFFNLSISITEGNIFEAHINYGKVTIENVEIWLDPKLKFRDVPQVLNEALRLFLHFNDPATFVDLFRTPKRQYA